MQDDEALKNASRFNIAIDDDGKQLPFSPAQVERIMQSAITDGEVIAAIIRFPNGNTGVHVFGPPSERLADELDRAARGYREALKKRH